MTPIEKFIAKVFAITGIVYFVMGVHFFALH